MKELRLAWEPESMVSLDNLEDALKTYTNNKGGVSLLKNGTVLFIKSSGNDIEDAKKGLEEAKFLTDFEVQKMDDNDYLIVFHAAVAVFVSNKEFMSMKSEISKRTQELMFPSENFISENKNEDDLLIGLYARGKLQRDANHFAFFKRI